MDSLVSLEIMRPLERLRALVTLEWPLARVGRTTSGSTCIRDLLWRDRRRCVLPVVSTATVVGRCGPVRRSLPLQCVLGTFSGVWHLIRVHATILTPTIAWSTVWLRRVATVATTCRSAIDVCRTGVVASAVLGNIHWIAAGVTASTWLLLLLLLIETFVDLRWRRKCRITRLIVRRARAWDGIAARRSWWVVVSLGGLGHVAIERWQVGWVLLVRERYLRGVLGVWIRGRPVAHAVAHVVTLGSIAGSTLLAVFVRCLARGR